MIFEKFKIIRSKWLFATFHRDFQHTNKQRSGDFPHLPQQCKQVNIFHQCYWYFCCAVFDVCAFLFYQTREVTSIKKQTSRDVLMNDQIYTKGGLQRNSDVRLLGPDNEQLGIHKLADAQKQAVDRDLDLVLMVKGATPPVCRVMDYGKYCFERNKKEKEAKKKQQVNEIKEIRLSYVIDQNDLNTKIGHAKKFLEQGHKVKLVLRFRGRQIAHQRLGIELLEQFRDACAEISEADKKPVLDGRSMTMVIHPLKSEKKAKEPKESKDVSEKPAETTKE